ncbi:MAG: hypothetical protein QOE23_1384 [Pseudonocardiales bacterium]|jgi:hypothetical protein|nr:hypothetical protein [Pseudonocardiales bacterium]
MTVGAALIAFLGSSLVFTGPAAAAGLLSTVRVSVSTSLAPPSPMAGPVEYDPTNVTSVGGYARTDKLSIAMGGGTANRSFSLDLQAPNGETFSTGTYYGDDVDGVRGYGTLGEGSQSCSNVRFTIVDIASSGTAITRLDVRFQTTCGYTSNDNAIIFGELQLGEPSASPYVVTGARSFSWPHVPVGTRSPALLPLWFRNTATTGLAAGSASWSGADGGDFPVVSDGCSGRTLAPHASCSVVLAFAPRAAGTRSATLTVPIGGRNIATVVAGTGPAGRTLLRINSQPGDYVGGGKSYLITDAQARMQVATQGPGSFHASTQNAGAAWEVRIDDGSGGPLTVGTHPATGDGSNGFRFLVTGEGRGCASSTATVTIKQVGFDADHAPIAFDATFTQTCRFSTGASLTGEIAYRATTTPVAATGPFILHSGQSLAAGSSIGNGESSYAHKLAVTTAGRAVLTDSAGRVVWATPATAVAAGDRLAVKTAGNLALVTSSGTVLWTTTASSGAAGNLLVLQSDGNLVLYNAGYLPIWASGTAQPTG